MSRLEFLDMGGEARLRIAKPEFDASDPGLTNEQLVFDSGWPEILSIHQGSWAQAVTAAVETIPVSGGSWIRTYVTVNFPTLPFRPLALAWQVTDYPGGTPIGGYTVYRSYRAVQCTSHTDHITATMPGGTCAYVIFANPLQERDVREDDASGQVGAILGNHPTRGMGLFIGRRGADIATCPDEDLRLSTDRPAFQIAEAGVVWGVSSDGHIGVTIPLRRAFPTRPPVIVLAGQGTATMPGGVDSPTVYWLDDETIQVGISSSTSQPVQYLIPSGDPSYVDVPDTVLVTRVIMDPDVGLIISQADVDAATAEPDQLLLNSDYSALHVSERATVSNGGAAAIGTVAVSPQVSAVPLTIWGAYFLGRWWCAPGGAWTGYPPNYDPVGSPPVPNGELFAYMRDARRIRYVWAPGNSTPQWTVAIIDHSAVAFEEVTYTGPALLAESTYDDFSGATPGAAAPGWTVRPAITAISLRAETVAGSISGTAVRGRTTTSNDGTTWTRASLNAAGSTVGDCDILIGLMMTGGVSEMPGGAWFKGNSGGTNYQLGGLLTDLSGGVAADKRVFIGPDTASPPAEALTDWAYDTWYWLRVNVSGDKRALKLWPRGEVEPDAWNLIGVGPGLAAGYVGLVIPAATTNIFAWIDFFSVCTTGRPAWGPL